MNDQQPASLDALVQERLEADTEFQSSLEGLNEDEVAEATTTRSGELRDEIFSETREYGQNQKVRAEKAEDKGKPKDGDVPKPPKAEEKGTDDDEPKLSLKDSYALQKSDVHIDDIDEVVKAAKMLGVDIPTALNDDVLQGILKRRTEERDSAEAASTGSKRPGTHKPTSQEIVKKASEGKAPEPGTEEAEDLYYARRGGRKS